MGGSPPCGDSVRAVKDLCRQTATAKNWPSKPKNDQNINFSDHDTIGVHTPHNVPPLIKIGIGLCEVTKVLIGTCSLVDLTFRETLDKMEVDLRDMKPSTRSLTGIYGTTKEMIGIIRLSVYVGGITRSVKLSIHSIKSIPSTYHQCIKFSDKNKRTCTIRGAQRAARDLLVATVKLQREKEKLGLERSKVVNEEVDHLREASSITKKNGKWRVCMDFTDLNKAHPNDSFPLPHID
ncbi:hypothetical protein N665_0042s0006 [Sinapis alba]|nr:hypothetical protein N665_0042s0006 [Sinapis alba]